MLLQPHLSLSPSLVLEIQILAMPTQVMFSSTAMSPNAQLARPPQSWSYPTSSLAPW
jgi:hypothetical protein